MGDPHLGRDEVEAALEVRRELGPSYEPALVDSFAERIEAVIETRVDARLAARSAERRDDEERGSKQLALAITSMALGIPISAIAGGIAEPVGLVVAWAGIVGVNASYAWQNRRPRR